MLASTAPFAQVDALINQGVSQLLANATASWQGGKPFGVSLKSSHLKRWAQWVRFKFLQSFVVCGPWP